MGHKIKHKPASMLTTANFNVVTKAKAVSIEENSMFVQNQPALNNWPMKIFIMRLSKTNLTALKTGILKMNPVDLKNLVKKHKKPKKSSKILLRFVPVTKPSISENFIRIHSVLLEIPCPRTNKHDWKQYLSKEKVIS